MKDSFNKKAWVSDTAMQKSSPLETNLKGRAKANKRPESFTFDFFPMFSEMVFNRGVKAGSVYIDILSWVHAN